MFEEFQYYLNYELPEIIRENIDSLLYHINTTIGIAPIIIICVVLFAIFKVIKKYREKTNVFQSQNTFFEDLGNINEIEDAEEHMLAYCDEIGARYCAFYQKRGRTYILITSNVDQIGKKARLEVPLRMKDNIKRRPGRSGPYKVYNYISHDKNFLIRYYCLSSINLKNYNGYLEMMIKYYSTLRSSLDSHVDKQIVKATKGISAVVSGNHFGKEGFLKFIVATVFKVIGARGIRLFSDKDNFKFGEIVENELQKLFYIRNTPFKLEIYNNEALKPQQLHDIGNFLDIAGTFFATLSEDSKVIKLYLDFIKAANRAIEKQNEFFHNHSEKVATVAKQVGTTLFLGQDDLEHIELGALLHDIGMIGDMEGILSNSTELSTQELDIIKYHPIIGDVIVQPVTHVFPIGSIIKYHHERFDGKGYPSGIQGSDIPMNAQIVALAEFFVGLISSRSYKKGMSLEQAGEEIKKSANKMFDPVIVNAFIEAEDNIRKRLTRLDFLENAAESS